MNCGLGNKDSLKKHLLAGTLSDETRFDSVIVDIGRGVAGLMDQFCNRKLAYAENDTQIFRGDRSHWYVQRYPVAAWTKVELRFFKGDGWSDISGQPLSANEETGLLAFGYTMGRDPIQVRVTYSGGYYFETKEPDDDGYPSAQPDSIANNTLLEPAKFNLPDEIRLAWLTQCREVWNKFDKLGTGLVDTPDKQTATDSLKLAPMVKEILEPHRRYQIS